MKRRLTMFGLILAAAGALTLAGCSTSPAAPVQKVVTVQASTNALPDGTTQLVQTTQIVYRVSETWQRCADMAGSASSLIPQPWGGIVAGATSLLSVFLAFVARAANRRANRNGTLLDTVIDGVETANLPEVKNAIRTVAVNRGTQPALDAVVQGRTP